MWDGTHGPLSGQGGEDGEGVVVGEGDVGIEEDEQLGQELGKGEVGAVPVGRGKVEDEGEVGSHRWALPACRTAKGCDRYARSESVTSAGDEGPSGVGRHDVCSDAAVRVKSVRWRWMAPRSSSTPLGIPPPPSPMSSSPPPHPAPPLGIVYDSDDDMNLDSDDPDHARAPDLDADGESVDEESAPEHNGSSHHNAQHHPPHAGESVCHLPCPPCRLTHSPHA